MTNAASAARPSPRSSLRAKLVALALAFLVALFYALFPGQRASLALTIATGVRRQAVQARINEVETKAIREAPLSADDREFLSDFYGTLATGAKLSIVVGQTGRLMDHYLTGSGDDYRLAPSIFNQNDKVRAQMAVLRKRLAASPCRADSATSPTFYMPDSSKLDSVFGLYNGLVRLEQNTTASGACVLHWRAEVPWYWPSYASLTKKYGTPHGESFPLPNLQSILFGSKRSLFVDNGLGEYLAQVGLAKPFLAFAEWDEAR